MKITFELQGDWQIGIDDNTVIREVSFFSEDSDEYFSLEATNERLREIFSGILNALDREDRTDFVVRVREVATPLVVPPDLNRN